MIPIKVWLVEDDADYRRMMSRTLNRSENIGECRVFPSCIELFESIETESAPDIILMDLGLPVMSGVEGINKLATLAPDTAVVALTVVGEKKMVIEALQAGASGYLLKSSTGKEIIKGLLDVFWGGSTLSPAVARLVLDDLRKPEPEVQIKLATREIEVLQQLALGQSVKEMADTLGISQSTVSTYLGRIYSKLEVQSQSGAVAKALRIGIIE